MTTGANPEEQILSIVNNHWQACCLGAAAKLEIADHLSEGPLPVAELAKRAGVDADSIYRMLRALESTGIFKQTDPGTFANSAASERLRRHVPGSNWAWIRFTLCPGAPVFEGWRGLVASLQSGRPGFDEVHGASAWEHMQANPEAYSIFNLAMRDLSASIGPAVAAGLDWSRFPVVADIGGGVGSQLTHILDAHPSSRGILLDLPHVIAEAPDDDRIERIGGDFFKEIPVEADAYLLRWVLHDWSDEECGRILDNVRESASPGARLIVVESVIPETDEFDMGKWMDVNMMVMGTGRERTAGEFKELLAAHGFDMEDIVPTESPLSIIVGKQAQ